MIVICASCSDTNMDREVRVRGTIRGGHDRIQPDFVVEEILGAKCRWCGGTEHVEVDEADYKCSVCDAAPRPGDDGALLRLTRLGDRFFCWTHFAQVSGEVMVAMTPEQRASLSTATDTVRRRHRNREEERPR